ncbi:MAG: hypothetical protein IJF28_04205 [Firmicutes bacterium]|nr:hypothetical protein [Bacillota bacterium]
MDLIEKFKNGKQTIGTFLHTKSVPVIEALGYSGLDFVAVDMEHAPLSTDEVSGYLTAAKAADLPAIVRVSSGSRENILHMLDAGADGIIVPNISTVDEVKELVKHAKFMPVGERGFCPTRDGGWGFAEHAQGPLTEYMDYANRNTLLLPQCETTGCLEHIEEITAIEGVDGILIGPFDLSISMGIPGEFGNPLHVAAIKRILDACKKNGKLAMLFVGNTARGKQAFEEGFDSVIYGLDLSVLVETYKKAVSEIKAE